MPSGWTDGDVTQLFRPAGVTPGPLDAYLRLIGASANQRAMAPIGVPANLSVAQFEAQLKTFLVATT